MTTDYSKMTDAELNVAVAKALGWTAPEGCTEAGQIGTAIKIIPAYSTDATLALSLAEDWTNLAAYPRFWSCYGEDSENGYDVKFNSAEGDTWKHYEALSQPTFARAICIAFLSAQEEGK